MTVPGNTAAAIAGVEVCATVLNTTIDTEGKKEKNDVIREVNVSSREENNDSVRTNKIIYVDVSGIIGTLKMAGER